MKGLLPDEKFGQSCNTNKRCTINVASKYLVRAKCVCFYIGFGKVVKLAIILGVSESCALSVNKVLFFNSGTWSKLFFLFFKSSHSCVNDSDFHVNERASNIKQVCSCKVLCQTLFLKQTKCKRQRLTWLFAKSQLQIIV